MVSPVSQVCQVLRVPRVSTAATERMVPPAYQDPPAAQVPGVSAALRESRAKRANRQPSPQVRSRARRESQGETVARGSRGPLDPPAPGEVMASGERLDLRATAVCKVKRARKVKWV